MSFVVNPFNPLKLIETGWKYILHGKTDSKFAFDPTTTYYLKKFNFSGENGGPICTRGLKNIGNTCFLNCVLQAVSSCPLFVAHINAVANDPESGLFVNQLNRCVVGMLLILFFMYKATRMCNFSSQIRSPTRRLEQWARQPKSVVKTSRASQPRIWWL